MNRHKKKKTNEALGVFNILLVGDNPHAVSIADNIKSKFAKIDDDVTVTCSFNILDDIERDIPSHSWFNEFVFELTSASQYNNIVLSKGFYKWNLHAPEIERIYMKKLLEAMNVIIVDISECKNEFVMLNTDIPQYKFNTEFDFLGDLLKWIGGVWNGLTSNLSRISLVRSLCSYTLPYLGNVFGCLSPNKYENIVKSDRMRYNVPILFDEFCSITRGMTIDEIDKSVFTRTNSALAVFLK